MGSNERIERMSGKKGSKEKDGKRKERDEKKKSGIINWKCLGLRKTNSWYI